METKIYENLKKCGNNNVIAHYTCMECKSQQVTYAKNAEIFHKDFTIKGSTVVGNSCTACKVFIDQVTLGCVHYIEIAQ
jgi:hypothetical protein